MKPIVHYIGMVRFLPIHDDQEVAILVPLDHTSPLVSNSMEVMTSEVIHWNPITGCLETLNTIYLPEQEEQDNFDEVKGG